MLCCVGVVDIRLTGYDGVGVFLSIIGGVLVVTITRKGLDMQRWVERRWGEA